MHVFEISPGLLVWGLLTLVTCLVPAVVATWQSVVRGLHPMLGFALGLFLGWIGLVIVLLVTRPTNSRGSDTVGPKGEGV